MEKLRVDGLQEEGLGQEGGVDGPPADDGA